MDLFGSEQSTNAGNYFTAGLKGRWQETRRGDDHILVGHTREMNVVRDGRIVPETVPLLNGLNLDLRDQYVADCRTGVRRWNRALADAGVDARLLLPHEGFNRRVGAYSRHHVDPAGEVLSAAAWEAQAQSWLPTEDDRRRVAELMVPEYEYGKFASWIAPPPVGINDMPVEFDYVHLADEALL
jgi:benzoyl-CoA 2,3-dioxygenase component B